MRLTSLILPFLMCLMLSCSDNNDGLERYDVVIGGLQVAFDHTATDNPTFVQDIPVIPQGVSSLNVRVENKTHSYVKPIEKEFNLTSDEQENTHDLIRSVASGDNIFTAEAFANNPIRDWVDIEIQRTPEENLYDKKELELVSQRYSGYLKELYPEYTIYRDTVETYIGSKNDINEVDFHMKSVNARLSIVIENIMSEASATYDYIDIRIDGGEKKRVKKGTAVCYLINDDEAEETINLEVFTYRTSYPDWVDKRKYSLERGKNNTRLITVI